MLNRTVTIVVHAPTVFAVVIDAPAPPDVKEITPVTSLLYGLSTSAPAFACTLVKEFVVNRGLRM